MSRSRLAPSDAADERLQRMLEENHRLKAQLKEKDEKLKRVQTQFRKLTADLHLPSEGATGSGAEAPLLRPQTSPSTSQHSLSSAKGSVLPAVPSRRTSASFRSGQPSHTQSPLSVSKGQPHQVSWAPARTDNAELSACQSALAQAREEVNRLREQVQQLHTQQQQQQRAGAVETTTVTTPLPPLSGSSGGGQQQAQQQLHEMSQQLSNERVQFQQQLAAVQQQLFQAQAELQRSQLALQQQQHTSTAASAAQANAQQQVELQYRGALDKLARERDGLAVRLRLLEEERKGAATAAQPDPMSLFELQGEVRERSAQVTLLNSRLQNTQAQVETLKGECARLVEELKGSHSAHAELAKRIFQLEHEKCALQSRCSRLDEVELTVQRKNEELLRMEQELLKLTDSLRLCNSETEQAVRRELNARIADLEAMRDQADAQRREKERALLQCQSELADSRRRVTELSQDVDMYRVELSKAQREKAEMATHSAFAGHTMSEFSDDEVHRALAVAAMRRRGLAEAGGNAKARADASGGDASAADALDLYDALHWDETWEQGQLREALATAALDMELAETRCNQLADQAQQAREMLVKVSEERDTLLEENLEMRRRITGVQTVLAKQQLQAYRAAQTDAQQQHVGSIDLCVRGLHCVSPAMEKALGITRLGEPISVFLTLDGLSDYDTMLSPSIHALQPEEPLDVHFRYDGLDRDEATVGAVLAATFVFQLHRALTLTGPQGDETAAAAANVGTSALVAMAELPGAALMSARETTVEERLRLIDAAGTVIGYLFVNVSCSHLMLPVLLGRPLADAALLSAAEMRAVLVALRSIRFLRVQVFKAEGLPRSTATTAPRQLASSGGAVEVLDSSQEGDDNGGQRGVRDEQTDISGTAAELPQPYVFYTAQASSSKDTGAGFISCIADTVVHTANNSFTVDPVFDAAPVDHRVVVDRELVRFLSQGTLAFVVFDERASDVRTNLGVVEVPLHPLLASPQAFIRSTEPLHPQGSLSFGVSWVTGP